jgi:hypothetical protein
LLVNATGDLLFFFIHFLSSVFRKTETKKTFQSTEAGKGAFFLINRIMRGGFNEQTTQEKRDEENVPMEGNKLRNQQVEQYG